MARKRKLSGPSIGQKIRYALALTNQECSRTFGGDAKGRRELHGCLEGVRMVMEFLEQEKVSLDGRKQRR